MPAELKKGIHQAPEGQQEEGLAEPNQEGIPQNQVYNTEHTHPGEYEPCV